jgi:hypothetical protein
MYVVELEKGCWLARWSGDPGRTLKAGVAKVFSGEARAAKALKAARKLRPFKNAYVIRLEEFTVGQAALHAIKWCRDNPGWQRICDIEDTDQYYKTFKEMPKKVQNDYIRMYGEYEAEDAWNEFDIAPCKIPKGHISGKGDFYSDILDVPLFHNSMMVFKTGEVEE